MSHSVIFNSDGSFTCRRRYEPMSSPQLFARDIQRIVTAVRRGKIQIMELSTEGVGENFAFFVVRFKPLR